MFVSNIELLMRKRKATIRGVAALAGVSMQTVSRARGPMIERCTLDTLARIAAALGVRVKDLFSEEGEPGAEK